MLYLHGNAITDINQLTKLAALRALTKLAVHGNELITFHADTKKKHVQRLEDAAFYRHRIIYTLQHTNLKMLDFAAITPRDRQYALVWHTNHSKRKTKPGASLSPKRMPPPPPPPAASPHKKSPAAKK